MGGVLLSCSLYFQGEVLLSQFRHDGYGDTMFDLVLVLLLIMAGSLTLMLAIARDKYDVITFANLLLCHKVEVAVLWYHFFSRADLKTSIFRVFQCDLVIHQMHSTRPYMAATKGLGISASSLCGRADATGGATCVLQNSVFAGSCGE